MNSGGTALFVSPNAQIAVTPRFTLMIAPQIPVVQDLRSEQQETVARLIVGATLRF